MQEWVGWEEGAVAIKGNVRGPCDRNVLYLDFVSGNILVVILCYSFAKYYHSEKQDQEYPGLF